MEKSWSEVRKSMAQRTRSSVQEEQATLELTGHEEAVRDTEFTMDETRIVCQKFFGASYLPRKMKCSMGLTTILHLA